MDGEQQQLRSSISPDTDFLLASDEGSPIKRSLVKAYISVDDAGHGCLKKQDHKFDALTAQTSWEYYEDW